MQPTKGLRSGVRAVAAVAQKGKGVAADASFLRKRTQGSSAFAVPIHPIDQVRFQRIDGFHSAFILPDTLGIVKADIGRPIYYPKPMKTRKNAGPGEEARKILADNLNALMERFPQYGSERLLGDAAKVGKGSIGNMRRPDLGVIPTLDNIAKVAKVFQLEAWQLLHRDMPKRAMTERELEMYEAIERAYKTLPPLDHPAAKKP